MFALSLLCRLPALLVCKAKPVFPRNRGFTSTTNKNHGFTLVELLVVMAIISLLAGLLLPVLEESMVSVRIVDCANRQKQMMLGVFMHQDDNSGYWPTAYVGDTRAAYGFYEVEGSLRAAAYYMEVFDKLLNHVDGPSSPIMCPSSLSIDYTGVPNLQNYAGAGDCVGYFDGFAVNNGGFGGGYCSNPFFGNMRKPPNNDLSHPGRGFRKGTPSAASKVMYMVDSFRMSYINDNYKPLGMQYFRFRHGASGERTYDGRLNMSFADGHVKCYEWGPQSDIFPVSGDSKITYQPGFNWDW